MFHFIAKNSKCTVDTRRQDKEDKRTILNVWLFEYFEYLNFDFDWFWKETIWGMTMEFFLIQPYVRNAECTLLHLDKTTSQVEWVTQSKSKTLITRSEHGKFNCITVKYLFLLNFVAKFLLF